ncbi:hypothetical protein NHQ30_004201 [Ciborinia camelliae]|nr:hypothetical protein NHQ30_004201 [Ciborinia camelliae]
MPPPVTPSPHRFVIKKQPPPPPPRSQLAQESTPRLSNTQQFNTTPRFTFSSTPRHAGTQSIPSSTPVGRYLTPGHRTPKTRERIDDPSDDYPAQLPLHDSVETNGDFDTDIEFSTQNAEDDYEIDTRSSKRRRISPSPADVASEEYDESKDDDLLLSSSLPIVSSPISNRPNALPSTNSKPKFLLSTLLPPSTPQSTAPSTFLKPPRFRPPDPAETQGNTDPLPEQFSPHRKGQKYVAGGLAAEVRDWLIDIDSSIPSHGTTGVQKGKNKEWIVKMLVNEVSGSGRMGMCLVKGRQMRDVDGEEVVDDLGMVKVILAGEGTGTGLQRGRDVEVGKVVQIKGPVWEMVVEGEKWGVGVDWKVL